MAATSEIRSLRESRRDGEQARRRADAIKGASVVFAAKGFHDAQMTEIAAAAELSRASLYAMFKGKEELYAEVVQDAVREIRETVLERVAASNDPQQQLLCVIDSLFECFQENQHLLRIYARATHGLPWRLRQSMGDSAVEIIQAFVAWVTGVARRAKRAGYLRRLDPEAFALSLIGSVTTMAAQWIETRPDTPISEAAAPVRAIFDRILSARGGS